MGLANEIQAAAEAIRAEQPGIGAAELRARLRERFTYRSVWDRLDRAAGEWTARAHHPAAYLFALLAVTPAVAIWGALFGPRPEDVERRIQPEIDRPEPAAAEPGAAPDRGRKAGPGR